MRAQHALGLSGSVLENRMKLLAPTLLAKSLLVAGALILSTEAQAQITFYEGEGFRGRAFSAQRAVPNFKRGGINDFASSVVVDRGHWEVCDDVRYGGNCRVLRRGSYESLRGMGLNNRISSVRPVNSRPNYANAAPAPLPQPTYQYRRRPDERVYAAQVTSVRAVMGQENQRCWIERERLGDYRRDDRNVGGAIAGAIIGGILGHQVGGGRGQDAATIGGAVAGAAIGSRAGNQDRGYERNVQRCEREPRGAPQYWDVSYEYRGVEHWVRMSDPPLGQTIAVNRRGEPRQ